MLDFITNLFSPLTMYNGITVGGCLLDPPDPRDVPFTVFAAAAPVKASLDHVDLRPKCSPVENQSSLGSCVANAVVGGLELLENLQGMPLVDLSRLFLYYNCRAATGTIPKDSGTHIRVAMQTLTAQGVCPELIWPYNISTFTTRPSWKSYREAFGHKIRAFYKIPDTGGARNQQAEQSLINGNPVVFGMKVYQSFIDLRSFSVPPTSGRYLGRHAMLIVGFDRPGQYFIVRNSWGAGWGENGYCAIPYGMLDSLECRDVWSMTKYG